VLTLTDAMGIRTARLPIALYGVGALAGLCIIVCGIFYLLMLSRLAGRLREQYALAKRSWITSHNPAPDLIHGQPRA
jgi:hypothetical protein